MRRRPGQRKAEPGGVQHRQAGAADGRAEPVELLSCGGQRGARHRHVFRPGILLSTRAPAFHLAAYSDWFCKVGMHMQCFSQYSIFKVVLQGRHAHVRAVLLTVLRCSAH